jgi:hypothetical protein
MRHQPLLFRDQAKQGSSASMESIEESLNRFNSGTCFKDPATSVPRLGLPGRSAP